MFQSHRGMSGAAMSLTTAAGGFLVLLLTGTVVQGLNDWEVRYTSPQICASKGSTVEIHSTFRYPHTVNRVLDKFWHIRSTHDDYVNLTKEPEYLERVNYTCHWNSCTLTITHLKTSDSAEYKFRFITDLPKGKYSGVPGVTLTVTDLQVQVVRFQVHESFNRAEMTCRSSCRLSGYPHFAWYKNGWKIRDQTSDSYSVNVASTDNYSCAVDGYEASRSPPVYAPKSLSVSVSPSVEIKEGSPVTLNCSSDANPAANYTWYKNVNVKAVSEAAQLVFRSIQSSDSGEYYCAAENELGRRTSQHISIDVKYPPKPPSVSVSPSGEIVDGMSVNLSCSSDANPAANYTWYNMSLKHQGPEGSYHFTSISSEHRGNYYCKSENKYGNITSSPLFLDVQYAPKPPSVSVSPFGEIVEGMSVTLSCSSDAKPAAKYTWYNKSQKLLQGPGGRHHFSSISSEHRGNYYCKSENKYGNITSSPLFLDVWYAPKPPSVSVSPSGEIMEGSSVTLTCSSDANPAADYTWYKKGEDSPKASGQNFIITNARAEHSGNYSCKAQNKRGRHNSTLHLSVVAGFQGGWKTAVIGTTPAVFLAVIWLFVYLLIRKNRAAKQLSEPGDRAGSREECLPNDSEDQEDLHYATVHFNEIQDPVYCNVRPRRHKEEEVVEYAAVKFNRTGTPPRTRGPESGEDPAALYSTVNKTVE